MADCDIDFQMGGHGPALLLLHGFPQTKFAWHKMAADLSVHFSIIIPDLPGYGDSTGPPSDESHLNYSKRDMGNILDAMMQKLGISTYSVAGHDRGGRIAYRMALDYPKKITRLAVLDIIPTLEVVERLTYDTAQGMGNWFFLAQPEPVPETLIAANPELYLTYILNSWASQPEMITPLARAEYLRCFKKQEVIKAICEEYRAIGLDIKHDQESRSHHARISCPTLVLWSESGIVPSFGSTLTIWKDWADRVTGRSLPYGHFLMEECPDDVVKLFLHFFGGDS